MTHHEITELIAATKAGETGNDLSSVRDGVLALLQHEADKIAEKAVDVLMTKSAARKIAHRHCACMCEDNTKVMISHTNICDNITAAIVEACGIARGEQASQEEGK